MWLYRLNNDVILLVVTDEQLDAIVYSDTVAQLKATLESDPKSMVSTFRLLIGNHVSEHPTEAAQTAVAEALATPEPVTAETATQPGSAMIWDDYLEALNTLTDVTAQYLGKIVVANTWRTTRPDDERLMMIQLDRNGHFSFTSETEVASSASIEDAISMALHKWVSTFVKRCTLTIRNYEAMVIEQQLTAEQRAILQVSQAASDE